MPNGGQFDRDGNIMGGPAANVQVGSRTEQCPECEFAWMVGHDEAHSETCSRGGLDEIRVRFTHHPPKPGQERQYATLRSHSQALAMMFVQECPDCRERSLALTKLEEAVMWANAGIARRT